MTINNPKRRPRVLSFFVTNNKYQNEIVLLSFLPCAGIFFSFIIIVLLGNPAFIHDLFHVSLGIKISANQISEIIIFTMCFFFILSVIAGFVISHLMVGAYGRIIRELDEIIAGRSQKNIYGRPYDTLTNDLLKRINVLIEFYVAHKNKDR